ncbi:MAG: aspartate-semialdehyde dehydrogenase [Bacteroidetes bacterium]|nr:aspartate-semialdehyde dehydrogenase [Bacteroidota bacterium]HET6245479.1 aspartate-semialdehyde dehydrogenase [Bacteroidia bacterium]
MKIAVVGVTGLVGTVMLKVLEERKFPLTELIPVASENSVGKKVLFNGKSFEIVSMQDAIKQKPHIAIFSAGGEVSLKWAPEFAKVGTSVIDNSSAWRMHPDKKLIVPEINASELTKEDKIIANPNCSTIQLVMALAPLHKIYGLERIVVSTYQSVTGTGVKAVTQLENERKGITSEMAYRYPIDKNCIPQCDDFTSNGYTKEEMKLVNEPRKIFSDPGISITATAVRVPVVGGHSESVNVSFKKDFDLEHVRELLKNTKGISVKDDIASFEYPMPRDSQGRDEVFVGRLRRDYSFPNSLNMWIVADNLRKGAATNAIQIAEYLVQNNLIS